MKSMAVRISEADHLALREMAQERNISMGAALSDAIRRQRQELLLETLNEDYARLRADPVAWKEILEERAIWESTLADGLDEW